MDQESNCFFQISSAVCFLLSPGAAFMNGETVRVDAGASLYGRTILIQGGEIVKYHKITPSTFFPFQTMRKCRNTRGKTRKKQSQSCENNERLIFNT